MTHGYCVKCKTRRHMRDVTVKKFRAYMALGFCMTCGTKMSRALKNTEAQELFNQAVAGQ